MSRGGSATSSPRVSGRAFPKINGGSWRHHVSSVDRLIDYLFGLSIPYVKHQFVCSIVHASPI